MIFNKFCYVCKQHFPVSAESQKQADTIFAAAGHDDEKVAQLKRGPVGKEARAFAK